MLTRARWLLCCTLVMLITTQLLVRYVNGSKFRTTKSGKKVFWRAEFRLVDDPKVEKKPKYYFNSCECGLLDVKEQRKRTSQTYFRKRFKRQASVRNYKALWKGNVHNSTRVDVGRMGRHKKTRRGWFDRLAPGGKKDSGVVVGGQQAGSGQAPWHVVLEDMNNAETCGGSIINARYILTAAHCTEFFRSNFGNPKQMEFPRNILAILRQPEVCGQQHTLVPAYTRRIIRVKDHPRYGKHGKFGELIFDFALLEVDRLMHPFGKDLRPVCLPSLKMWKKKFVKKTVRISGYGRVDAKNIAGVDQTSCVMKLGWTKVISPKHPYCSRLATKRAVQMCAYSRNTDACQGDSGGPMTIKTGDSHFLIGVVSYGSSECASKQAAGVYARVTAVMPWIMQSIQSGECRYESDWKQS